MLKEISKILLCLPLRLRIEGVITIVLISAATSFQSLLVLTIQPFLGIFEQNQTIKSGQSLYKIIADLSNNMLTVNQSICIVFASIALISMCLRLTGGWMNGNYTSLVGNELNLQALQNSLDKPYIQQKQINKAHQIADIQQGQAFATGILGPLIQLVASSTTIIATIIAATRVSISATLSAFAGAICIFGVIAMYTKNKLKRDGAFLIQSNRRQLQLISESFGGIRDLVFEGRSHIFLKEYTENLNRNRLIGVRIGFLQTAPRYLIEGVGFATLGLVGLVYLKSPADNSVLNLGILGSLALAFQIILPSLQQVFNCWTSLKSGAPVIDLVSKMLDRRINNNLKNEKASWPIIQKRFEYNKYIQSAPKYSESIEINNLTFKYPGSPLVTTDNEENKASNTTLSNISFNISRGDIIGIAGKTGSGKSTLIDILCGLVAPTSGNIYVDANPVYANDYLRAWWLNQVSYVPQTIFLTDSSILENIILGAQKMDINWEKLLWACEAAEVSGFVDSLPSGMETRVGEAGIQLSGGQRQRIGLARALYKKKEMLILDEATSALDVKTESNVIKAITRQKDRPTIVMIAHRLSSLRDCNKIIILENGKIIKSGGHKELSMYFSGDKK